MLNLLSTAANCNPSGGLIRFIATRASRMADIAFIDTGIGVPAGEQQRIFEEFTQIDRAGSEQTEGTGLGFKTIFTVPAEQEEMATTCKMKRPAS